MAVSGSKENGGRLPEVVIIGAGFGGLSAARALAGLPLRVTVIDRRNYHLFQPLLYQVATAGLSPAQIAAPIRRILRGQKNTRSVMDRVVGIDRDRRVVTTETQTFAFDYLIVATGARHNYYGNDQWEETAPGLKKIDDATSIRRRVLLAFEQAENATSDEEVQRLLTFVVVGGGPTGVEMAGAIAELARKALAEDFRRIDPGTARVILVEAGPRLLPTFSEPSSLAARKQLEALGVEVMAGVAVAAFDAGVVKLADGSTIESSCAVWSAGVMASPAARWLNSNRDAAGRVLVSGNLTLPDDPRIYVVGDTASLVDARSVAVPGVAPAAKQMGRYAARSIARHIHTQPPLPPFRYRNYGNLATLGRKAAVAEFGPLRLSGFPAWLLWSLIHIYFLIGHRNRLGVILDWAWAYATYDRGARLITGSSE